MSSVATISYFIFFTLIEYIKKSVKNLYFSTFFHPFGEFVIPHNLTTISMISVSLQSINSRIQAINICGHNPHNIYFKEFFLIFQYLQTFYSQLVANFPI